MTGLRELFEEAVASPPPSRLTAAEVYAAGRRQLRCRSAVAAGAGVATCVAVVSVAALVATGAAQLRTPEPSVSGVASTGQQLASPGVLPYLGEHVQWVGAADAQHLYVAQSPLSSCPAAPCAKTIMQLVGSDDGGRTWSVRGAPIKVAGPFAVLGPGTLAATVGTAPSGPGRGALRTSTDGGRTWHPVERAPAVPAVPTGSTAACWSDLGAPKAATSPCILQALDPVARRIAPLTGQPPLILSEGLLIEESAGQLWAPGTDPATGRPGVAVSTDAGRTWSTQVFTDAPGCALEGCQPPRVATGAGRTGYAVVVGARKRAVYRRADNGGWQRLTGADQLPYEPADAGSFVAADGAHVLYQLLTDPARGSEGYRYWAARGPGTTYQPVEPDGLPAQTGPPRRASDGWFYAYGDDIVYGSTDGWHWSLVTRR